jgi:hypothetical protein
VAAGLTVAGPTHVVHWSGDNGAAVAGSVAGLGLAAEWLLGESTSLAPIDEGTLIRSAVADVDAGDLAASVSYDTVYAARQHEELTWRHDPGRQAKYLEEPANAGADTMLRIIGQAIRDELR